MAKRLIQRFSIGQGFLMRIFFGNAQPYTVRFRMVFLQPMPEIRGSFEMEGLQELCPVIAPMARRGRKGRTRYFARPSTPGRLIAPFRTCCAGHRRIVIAHPLATLRIARLLTFYPSPFCPSLSYLLPFFLFVLRHVLSHRRPQAVQNPKAPPRRKSEHRYALRPCGCGKRAVLFYEGHPNLAGTKSYRSSPRSRSSRIA